jgi:S-DNA-T family DNA segregation ATPase FtsK/SpoIIIE
MDNLTMDKGQLRAEYGGMLISVLLLLLASLMLFSLISFHPNDPSLLSRGGVSGGYKNWCGFIGANLAGLPIALVGFGAWLLPLYIVWDSLSKEIPRWHRRTAWLIFALSVWTVLGAFGETGWPFVGTSIDEQIKCGGWVGYVLWPWMQKVLGRIGLPISLSVTILLSLAVMAPKPARYVFSRIVMWLRERAWPWLKPIMKKWYQLSVEAVKKPFLKYMHRKQEEIPELNAMDGMDMKKFNDYREAVMAYERAQKETDKLRRSAGQAFNETYYQDIRSINIDADTNNAENSLPEIKSTIIGYSNSEFHGPFVLMAEPALTPLDKPIPPNLLRDLPTPPPPKPPLVQPKFTRDYLGRSVEEQTLGLSEPTPNQPLPEIRDSKILGSIESQTRFDLPPQTLFNPPDARVHLDPQLLEENKALIQQKLTEFKVKGQITGLQPGPVVTVYEFSPDPGVGLGKVMSMEEDLALGLKAENVRIDRITGKNVVGIEVPNPIRETIRFREILDSPEFKDVSKKDGQSLLSLALGKDIGGRPVAADLAKMPHLLIGGSTGSGKSVGVNAMICSILLSARADEVKLILVDPKLVEFAIYEDIPHLWAPVVSDMKEAGRVLKWVVSQMEDRYKRLTLLTVRNLEQFNAKVIKAGGAIDLSDRTPNPKWPDRPRQLEPLPYVVVIIDELADLMMVCRSEVEESIARIAQKARAVGIHLILATQRPSVDVVTGVIKANLPARLSYRVNTKIDSRTILDSGGGEQLLGKGDALFLAPGTARLRRIHAPFIEEDEIERLVNWLKARGAPDYNEALIQAQNEEGSNSQPTGDEGAGGGDDIYDRAVAIVKLERKASTSLLQRKLNIGYGRAARIIDRMEAEGFIGSDRGAGKPREVFLED